MALLALKHKLFPPKESPPPVLPRFGASVDAATNYGSIPNHNQTTEHNGPDSNTNVDGGGGAHYHHHGHKHNSGSQAGDEDDDSDMDSLKSEESKLHGVFSPRVISDAIIGLSDGLTVPFALTAGLSSLGSAKLVITGGLAELVSGSISMGLGGYLAARGEIDYYKSEVTSQRQAHAIDPCGYSDRVAEILLPFDVSQSTIDSLVRDLQKDSACDCEVVTEDEVTLDQSGNVIVTPARTRRICQKQNKQRRKKAISGDSVVDFVIKFGLGLEQPPEGRELQSCLTIGIAYFLGGFIPLIPYFFASTVETGLWISVVIMFITLLTFGLAKTLVTINHPSISRCVIEGLKMAVTGGVAAGAAYAMVRYIQ